MQPKHFQLASRLLADEEAALATQEINQSDIQSVLADFDDVWDALPPREQSASFRYWSTQSTSTAPAATLQSPSVPQA